mgnify:CR=1 FL=1
MKILGLLIGILAITFATPLQAQEKERDFVEVTVEGLGCPFCAYGLEKKIKELKNVKKVAIDIETGLTSFYYPTEKAITIADVEHQVDIAGYSPKGIKITRADGSVEEFEPTEEEIDVNVTGIVEASFKTLGRCGMCETRIEKAAKKHTGVKRASWDEETMVLTVSYDAAKTDLTQIKQAVANVGHDTEEIRATDKSYKDLHGCCKYDRDQF